MAAARTAECTESSRAIRQVRGRANSPTALPDPTFDNRRPRVAFTINEMCTARVVELLLTRSGAEAIDYKSVRRRIQLLITNVDENRPK